MVLVLLKVHFTPILDLVRNCAGASDAMLPEDVLGVIALDLAKVASPSEAVEVVEGDSLHARGLDVQIGKSHQGGVVAKDGVLKHLDHLVVGDRGVHQLVADPAHHLREECWVGCDAVVGQVDHVPHKLSDLLMRVLVGTCQLKRLPLQLVDILLAKDYNTMHNYSILLE